MDDTPREDELVIRYSIAAPRDRVFAAWTDPGMLRQWWGPGDFTCPEAHVDLRPGGDYRLVMKAPQGPESIVTGTYEAVEPPARLVYTWRWAGGPPSDPESLVTVEFADVDGDTEVTVRHSRLPQGDERSQYDFGWRSGLEKFERLLTVGRAQPDS